jgi:hypothetical protein
MRRIIIIVSTILALGLALLYKYMILDPPPLELTVKRVHGDIFQNIQFNNGYDEKTNLQEHYSNLILLEKFNEEITRDHSSSNALIDSIQLGRAQLYYWLWESYSAAALLASKLSLDLYQGPPSSVTNPKLPLHDVENLSANASRIVNNTLPELSVYLERNSNSMELAKFMAIQSKISDCDSLVSLPPKATIQNDDNAFVIDPYVFGFYSNCFHSKAILGYKEILEGNSQSGEEYYKANLQYLILLGNSPDEISLLNTIVNNEIVSALSDSMKQGLYSNLIFDVTSLLLQKKILNYENARNIIEQSKFPYAELLLTLMLNNAIAESDTSDKVIQLPTWLEIVVLEDPLLAPKLVENMAKYYDAQKEYSKGSILINNFWFADASNFPPRVWWFDNYPKFMLLSYAFGRLDGGRLPLWVDNLYQISDGDKLLGELMELAKYYNMVAFY